MHKPADVLKFLSVLAFVILCRLYTNILSSGNRCEETANCFNLTRTEEVRKFVTLLKSVLS